MVKGEGSQVSKVTLCVQIQKWRPVSDEDDKGRCRAARAAKKMRSKILLSWWDEATFKAQLNKDLKVNLTTYIYQGWAGRGEDENPLGGTKVKIHGAAERDGAKMLVIRMLLYSKVKLDTYFIFLFIYSSDRLMRSQHRHDFESFQKLVSYPLCSSYNSISGLSFVLKATGCLCNWH